MSDLSRTDRKPPSMKHSQVANLALGGLMVLVLAAGCGSFSKPAANDGGAPNPSRADAAGTGGSATGGMAPSGGAGGSGGFGGGGGAVGPDTPSGTVDALDVSAEAPAGSDVPAEAPPATCTNSCTAGQTRCAGGSVQSCVALASGCMGWGPAMACPARQTCPDSGTKCDCAAGNHRCDDRCEPDDSVLACGVACVACPVPQNGSATCRSGVCGAGCNNGLRACGMRCIPTEEPCGNTCPDGRHLCGGACVSNSIKDGDDCSDPCNTGRIDCSGRCVRTPRMNGTPCGSASCGDRNNAREAGRCTDGTCTPGRRCDYHGCDSSNRCTDTCPREAPNDTGTACEACGRDGQKCCAGPTCNPNHQCDQNLICRACGGNGQQCCKFGNDYTCRDGMTCFSGRSGPPGRCAPPCGAFLQRCCNVTAGEAPIPCPGDGVGPTLSCTAGPNGDVCK